MRRARIIGLVAACVGAVALCAKAADAAATSFKRGATLVEFFTFPATGGEGRSKAYASPPYPRARAALESFDFDDLRRIGFDHMRIPVDVGPLIAADAAQRRDFMHELTAVVAELQRHDLGVVVTLHPPSLQHELPETYLDGPDGPKFTRHVDVVVRIAGELAALRSGTVALEPMNEPQSDCRRKFGVDWTVHQEAVVARIRQVAPELPVLLTGGCWSNIEGIVLLDTDLLRDRRNLVSVHFYYPFLFTHQGATWTLPYVAGTIGVPYPASSGSLELALSLTRDQFQKIASSDLRRLAGQRKAEQEIRKYFQEAQGLPQIEGWMGLVADWQRRQRIDPDQILFTEFGAMKQKIDGVEIDKASRARWLRDASATIEDHKWGWTVYVLRDDPFGLYDHPTDPYPDRELLRALRLNVPADAPPGTGDR
jgi:hypothetical protein